MEKKTILIVDDDGVLAVRLQNMLIELGYNVPEPVATGEEAIAAVAAERPDLILPDLILMDIQLAGEMDGITAAERICSVIDVPIVFLTAFSKDPVLQRAKAIAPYGYLIKPVSSRELTATIEIAFHRHSFDRQLKEINNVLCLAQAELKEAREDLEKKVQERTQELQKTNEMLVAEIEKRMKSEETLQENQAQYRLLSERTTASFRYPDGCKNCFVSTLTSRNASRRNRTGSPAKQRKQPIRLKAYSWPT